MSSKFLSTELIEHIKNQFLPDWQGIHGVRHWARVRVIGRRLAKHTGANLKVVELFAFLHDTQRHNDGHDPDHGLRASNWIDGLNGKFFDLDENELTLLKSACEDHTKGYTTGDITVRTCWDSDRLDLGRVGIKPDPAYLCTDIGRDKTTIKWAYARSLHNNWSANR